MQYTQLKASYEVLKKRSKNGTDAISLRTFLDNKIKGSKKFRKIIMGTNLDSITKLTQYKTYCRLTDILPAELSKNRAIDIFSCWDTVGLSNRLKVFLFKESNNSRVNKFNAETNPACTFCMLQKKFPAPLETFSHIFYDCEFIQPIIMHDLLRVNNVTK